ncbi:MAG TPA: response regulator [Reyranella sp.]|nr:response regulator [Reyranella sp.]
MRSITDSNALAGGPFPFMEPSQPDATVVNPLYVLVVEDEALVRLMAATHLTDQGFSVTEAASADAAVGILQGESVAMLVFSDIQMPGSMDGVDLARWIARERPELKVLLTSGRPIPEAARAWAFIAKPYRMKNVERQLREMAGG